MKLAWKQVEDPGGDLVDALAKGKNAFRFLISILDSRIETNRNQTLLDNYDNPNWALKQADLVGELRAYKEISALLKSTLDSN